MTKPLKTEGGLKLPTDLPAVVSLALANWFDFYGLAWHFEVSASDSGTWLILSERWAMFHGWKARMGGRELKIYRCNHVNTAIWIPSGASTTVERTYSPPGFWLGVCLSGLGWVALGVGLTRRRP